MYINYFDQEVSFNQIPKCGTSTIRNSLGENYNQTNYAEFRSFTMIRNPKDRILSAYHETLRRGKHRGSLLDLMIYIKKHGHRDNHTEPIVNYLDDVDKVFIFPDYKGLSKWVGFKIEGHENKTETNKDDWNKQSLEILNELYQKDIELFEKLRK